MCPPPKFVQPTWRSGPSRAVVLVPRPTDCTPAAEWRAFAEHWEVEEGGCSVLDRWRSRLVSDFWKKFEKLVELLNFN